MTFHSTIQSRSRRCLQHCRRSSMPSLRWGRCWVDTSMPTSHLQQIPCRNSPRCLCGLQFWGYQQRATLDGGGLAILYTCISHIYNIYIYVIIYVMLSYIYVGRGGGWLTYSISRCHQNRHVDMHRRHQGTHQDARHRTGHPSGQNGDAKQLQLANVLEWVF